MNKHEQKRARDLVLPTIDSALDEWVDTVGWAIHRGEFTEEQVTEAVLGYPDFEDAWDERNRDDS